MVTKFLYFIAFILLNTAVYGQNGIIKFKEESYNFGKIPQGVPVTHEFTFKNTGQSPIIISKVEVSCGCTIPEFSSKPVQPGETGSIKATYNAEMLHGFSKPLTVLSNSVSPSITLYLKGEVVKNVPTKATTK